MNGYIVENVKKQFPESKYIAPIEEHNIHAIFMWDSILDIIKDEETLREKIIDEGTAKKLNYTDLTVSVTRLGTCIYRVGSKLNQNRIQNA